jgi:hypothetical protein
VVSILTTLRDFVTARSYALPGNVDTGWQAFGVPPEDWAPAAAGIRPVSAAPAR